MVQLALQDHLDHEGLGFWSHSKISKPRRKPCQAQYAHRVFPKGRSGVAQHFVGNVLLAPIRVYQCARRVPSFRWG